MYQLFMKLTGGEKMSLTINEDWTVAELKKAVVDELICRRQQGCFGRSAVLQEDKHDAGLGLGNSNGIRVIFAGVELLDSLNVKECEIPDGSMIHIVIERTDSLKRDDKHEQAETDKLAYSSLLSGLSDLEVRSTSQEDQTETSTESSLESKKKPCFYVFCKDPCGTVTKGKLRVSCQKCKKGAFTVLQDVTCWEDVLTPGKIPGHCRSNGCSGNMSCANHQTYEDDRVPALHLLKTNTRDVPCLACEHVFDPVLVFPCDLGHAICLECFKLYCQTKLNDRQFVQHNQIGYSLPCPAGCENSLIQETHHFRILGNDDYNKYQSFATEECVLQNGGMLCPAPGCGTAIFAEDNVRRFECLRHGDIGCGFVFCRDCKLSYHDGDCTNTEHELTQEQDGYQVDMARVERARWEQASRTAIEATTKSCPNCKAPVEKNGGCMHMQCPRANCKFEWCWLCSVAWNNNCVALHWFGEEPFFL